MENLVKALLEEGFTEEQTSKLVFDILEGKAKLKLIEAEGGPRQIPLSELKEKPARGVTEATKPYWNRAIEILESQGAKTSTYGTAVAIMNNVIKRLMKDIEEGKVAVAMLQHTAAMTNEELEAHNVILDALKDGKPLDVTQSKHVYELLTENDKIVEASKTVAMMNDDEADLMEETLSMLESNLPLEDRHKEFLKTFLNKNTNKLAAVALDEKEQKIYDDLMSEMTGTMTDEVMEGAEGESVATKTAYFLENAWNQIGDAEFKKLSKPAQAKFEKELKKTARSQAQYYS